MQTFTLAYDILRMFNAFKYVFIYDKLSFSCAHYLCQADVASSTVDRWWIRVGHMLTKHTGCWRRSQYIPGVRHKKQLHPSACQPSYRIDDFNNGLIYELAIFISADYIACLTLLMHNSWCLRIVSCKDVRFCFQQCNLLNIGRFLKARGWLDVCPFHT